MDATRTDDRQAALRRLDAARAVTADATLRPVHAALEALAERLRAQRFHLAVLGQFKRGKSTLVNALLRRSMLPTGLVPVTALPTFVSPGDATEVRVVLQDGTMEAIDPSRLADFVTEKKNPGNQRGVARVEIQTPAPILDRGVVLVDTPGIGSIHGHNTEAALGVLPECDAALFVLSVDPPVTRVEMEFLETVRRHVPRLFFVLNKVDGLAPEEVAEAEAYLREALAANVGEIWPVSARQALRDGSGLAKSGLPALEAALLEFFRDEKTATLARAMQTRTTGLLLEARSLLDLQRKSLEMPLQEFQEKAREFSALTARFREERVRIQDSLAADRQRFAAATRQAARALAAAALEAVRAALEGAERDLPARASAAQARAALTGAAESAIADFYDVRRDAFREQARGRAGEILESVGARATALLDAAADQTARLFGVEKSPPLALDLRLQTRSLFWKTRYWHGDLSDRVRAGLSGLLSRPAVLARIRDDLKRDAEMLCTRNANLLFNEAEEQLDLALREAGRELDRRLEEAAARVRAALAEVERRRGQGADAARGRLAELRALEERIQALT